MRVGPKAAELGEGGLSGGGTRKRTSHQEQERGMMMGSVRYRTRRLEGGRATMAGWRATGGGRANQRIIVGFRNGMGGRSRDAGRLLRKNPREETSWCVRRGGGRRLSAVDCRWATMVQCGAV